MLPTLVNSTAIYSFPIRNFKTIGFSHHSQCPCPLNSSHQIVSILPLSSSLPITSFISSACAPNQAILDCLNSLPVFSLDALPPVHHAPYCQQADEKLIMLPSPLEIILRFLIAYRVRFKFLTWMYKAVQYLSLPTDSASCFASSPFLTPHTSCPISTYSCLNRPHFLHLIPSAWNVLSPVFLFVCVASFPSTTRSSIYHFCEAFTEFPRGGAPFSSVPTLQLACNSYSLE